MSKIVPTEINLHYKKKVSKNKSFISQNEGSQQKPTSASGKPSEADKKAEEARKAKQAQDEATRIKREEEAMDHLKKFTKETREIRMKEDPLGVDKKE